MAGELVTGPGLVQWGTLLIGRWQAGAVTTPYRWSVLGGWEDLPGLDSGTVARAQQSGAYPGRLLAQTRIVTLDGMTIRAPAGQIGAAVRTLNAAMPLAQTEQPLVIWADDRGPLLVNARVVRRHFPMGNSWSLGSSWGGAVQWEATDPRRYQLTEQTVTTGLPSSEAGLVWGSPEVGLVWGSPETGLAWGTPGSTGDMTCTNSGDASAHPIVEIRGPATNPSVTLLASGVVLEYGVTLVAGDVLTIDTWLGTVTLGGQSRIGTATNRSSPEGSFTLPSASTSTISFRSTDAVPDPAASATVRWRSAYW